VPSSSAWTHRVDAYASAVRSGDVLAGPYVRLACERHFRDRQRAADDPAWYQFSEERADHIIEFIETCLRLPDVVDDDGEPKAFILSPWQVFIVGSLFGWINANGHRRFREAYIEAGKGAGKTPLLAAIGLYGLMLDGERAAEIYAAAADQDQAMIMFRDAVRIATASPDIAADLSFAGGQHIWQLTHDESMSFFRTFSREGGQKSGPRPHMGLVDELHEQPSPEVSTKIRAGAKRRPQPLFIEITNSGFDRTSICWQRHEHSRRVVEHAVEDEQLFAYVCALDEGDDPLKDESCWPKTNPNIGISVTLDYLRRQVSNAKNIPAEMNGVLRLNFCVWTNQHTRAIDIGKWLACEPLPDDAELVGATCYGGLDLGLSDDLSAWARLWDLEDGRIAVKMRFWIPEAAFDKYPNRPYAEWKRAGILTVTRGDTTDYDLIEDTVAADCHTEGIREVAYDKRFAEQLAQHLLGAGITMVNTPQGFQLNEAIRKKLELIATGKLCHGNDPILSWMATNYVLITGRRDGAVRPDKDKAGDKIDGQVAIDMALDRIVRKPVERPKTFQMIVIGGGR
jgi:phage terminase large subunit-like protein